MLEDSVAELRASLPLARQRIVLGMRDRSLLRLGHEATLPYRKCSHKRYYPVTGNNIVTGRKSLYKQRGDFNSMIRLRAERLRRPCRKRTLASAPAFISRISRGSRRGVFNQMSINF